MNSPSSPGSENLYRAPSSVVSAPPPLPPLPQSRVTGWRRFGNYIIDHIGWYLFLFACAFVAGALGALVPSLDKWISGPASDDFSIALVVFSYFAYYAGGEALFGVTLGKLITGTKVVDLSGGRIGFGKAMLRTLCRFIPFEPVSGLGAGGPWHDTITRTKVILRQPPALQPRSAEFSSQPPKLPPSF